jgi:hypothetical protein
MGVKHGSKTLHLVSDMAFADLVEVLKAHAKEQGSDRAKVVADCNNLVYIFSKASSNVEAVTNHLMKFAKEGLLWCHLLMELDLSANRQQAYGLQKWKRNESKPSYSV